ncbi:MAG: hypothetical protein OEM82_00230 [Acidobacteriota bacterium]|nr:hypothetical protein [Acidobacteriota bacterium]MDH3530960.1 hypothetical protein [Acidobacteriota bacterium]
MFGKKTRLKSTKAIGSAVCAGCGAAAVRDLANYCITCGKTLGEDYQPLDRIRSSYRLQGRAFLIENAGGPSNPDLFSVNRNSVSETAWASCVYSMVPYVGVVFIPFTIVSSLLGLGIAIRRPSVGGGKMSAAAFGLSFAVATVQVFLWWLLYVIPELAKPF